MLNKNDKKALRTHVSVFNVYISMTTGKEKHGWTTERVRYTTKRKLKVLKRILGVKSSDDLIVQLMQLPLMYDYLCMVNRDTAYELTNFISLKQIEEIRRRDRERDEAIQIKNNAFLVKK